MEEESQKMEQAGESMALDVDGDEKGAKRPEERPVSIILLTDIGDREVKPLFGDSVRIVQKRVLDSLTDVQDEIDRARQKAARIVAEAEEEGARIRSEAREEGRTEGYSEWLEELEGLREERERTIREAESDLLKLATKLAARIVGRAIESDPNVAAEVVAESLQHVRGDEQIVVHVAPDDLPVVQAVQKQLIDVVGGSMLYFEDDASLNRGDCVIITQNQRIDARLETQLEQMRRMLEGAQ